jgi:signal transduction histidine kinase/ActR/RegA family two-component response regulator
VKRFLRRLPIRLKLIGVIVLTSAVVLVLASLGFLVSDYYVTRDELVTDLQSQAELILSNSAAALEFDDRQHARETLETLSTKPNIRLACLYDAQGALFSSYRHADEQAPCPVEAPLADRTVFVDNHVEHARRGELQGSTFGSLFLRSDLDALVRRGRIQLTMVAFLLVFALGVAVVLSSALQTVVSDPVAALAGTAMEVSARGDYSLRATRNTEDELGVLVDAFNRMLDQIEARESDLSQANEELRREVAERRRAELERAELLVREREANRLKDEFLATLSHELRTPLNAILGWTKLLRSNAVPQDSMERALEKVERNAQVQSRLIEDLLEVSRIVSGKLRLEYRPLDLVALCATALESIRPTAEARGVEIRRQFEQASLPTIGDPDRLQQVIWNLLSNAVKFTPPDGVVTLTLRRGGHADEIVVTDTGIGIEPDFLPNVFETFRQADATSTRAHGGLGLGLSIVKRLVEMHGGRARASSGGRDQGATFTVWLPVRAAAPSVAEDERLAPPGSDATRLAGRDILVVDDDADTRELLVSAFEGAGGRVRAAASAAEGLALAFDRVPDAVVSDIAMPGEDGYIFIERLRARLGDRMPRVLIALSAFAAPGDHERSVAAGFQRHIVKPVDPLRLVRVLADMLGSQTRALL